MKVTAEIKLYPVPNEGTRLELHVTADSGAFGIQVKKVVPIAGIEAYDPIGLAFEEVEHRVKKVTSRLVRQLAEERREQDEK